MVEVLPPLSAMGYSAETTTAMNHVWAHAIARINDRGKCFLIRCAFSIVWECVQFYYGNTDRNEFAGVHPLPIHHV